MIAVKIETHLLCVSSIVPNFRALFQIQTVFYLSFYKIFTVDLRSLRSLHGDFDDSAGKTRLSLVISSVKIKFLSNHSLCFFSGGFSQKAMLEWLHGNEIL